MPDQLELLVDRLAGVEMSADVFNQYAHGLDSASNDANAIRRANLLRYLRRMAVIRPDLLLVGEAAGHRGCRLTGIPFTSEFILLNLVEGPKAETSLGGKAAQTLFGPNSGYRKTTEFQHIQRESTATIVWRSLIEVERIPLLWNAFPFHPHQPGRPYSNRTPLAREISLGAPFVTDLLRIFGVDTVIAVGNQAERALARIEVPAVKLRHPSHGGKSQFVAGLYKIYEGRYTSL